MTRSNRDDYEQMVKRPGKFEGEAPYVPYFWEQGLEFGPDDEEGYPEGDNPDRPVYVFYVEPADRVLFPELTEGEKIRLIERDNGFVIEI